MTVEPVTVAFQGEFGAFSEAAARKFFPSQIAALPCATFDELFAAVRTGGAQYGMAPVDNSLAGSIHPVWNLLFSEGLPIIGEIEFRVRHCLIGHHSATVDGLKRVLSHGQALAQCQDYLQNLDDVEQVEVYDTAGAVKIVLEQGDPTSAAIAAAAAAETYGMVVMARDIQTDADNYTRFLVLSHEAEAHDGVRVHPEAGMKTTIVAHLPDNGRSLPSLLASFTENGVEVLKVESCKRLGAPWAYTFYVELEGDATAPPLCSILAEMESRMELRVIGSYPTGQRCNAGET